ncbi:MAG: hypothetical protein ACR2P3_00240 [Geminicoccaceae bacterium]
MTPIPAHSPPAWLRLFGVFEYTPRYWLSRKFEVSWFTDRIAGLEICKFEENWSLNVSLWPFNAFIRLPFPVRQEPEEMVDSWGGTLHPENLHLHWGAKTKLFDTPWSWGSCIKSEMWDGQKWIPLVWRHNWTDETPKPEVVTAPYRYLLKSGEVQERTATAYAMRMEWRMKWLRWSPWPRQVRTSIDVQFSDEVGERTGSWKGGVLGTGHSMRRDEMIKECLNRMQREARFD